MELKLLVFIAGICLVLQSAFNAQLSIAIKSPIWATLVAYLVSVLLLVVYFIFSSATIPSKIIIRETPIHLWFVGAIFSLSGVLIYYYAIPRIGISQTIVYGLFAQLFFSAFASHFGWFGMPIYTLSVQRVFGLLLISSGVFLFSTK